MGNRDHGRREVMDRVEADMRAMGITSREQAQRWLADQPFHLAELTHTEDRTVAGRFDR